MLNDLLATLGPIGDTDSTPHVRIPLQSTTKCWLGLKYEWSQDYEARLGGGQFKSLPPSLQHARPSHSLQHFELPPFGLCEHTFPNTAISTN